MGDGDGPSMEETNPLAEIIPRMQISYTCNVCEKRSTKTFSKVMPFPQWRTHLLFSSLPTVAQSRCPSSPPPPPPPPSRAAARRRVHLSACGYVSGVHPFHTHRLGRGRHCWPRKADCFQDRMSSPFTLLTSRCPYPPVT